MLISLASMVTADYGATGVPPANDEDSSSRLVNQLWQPLNIHSCQAHTWLNVPDEMCMSSSSFLTSI